MNTRSISGAARVICEAMGRNRVPATIAVALDAGGWLNTSEAAAELVALRDRVTELETALALSPDPIAYGPRGYRCGCGKDAHSSLTPCLPDPEPPAGTALTAAGMAEVQQAAAAADGTP